MISAGRRRGFSLLELLIVVAVLMVVAAIATPNIISSWQAYRLRTAAGAVAGAFQRIRMQAVSDDRWYTVQAADVNMLLPGNIALQTTGPSRTSMDLDFTPTEALPSFNARGLPCTVTGGACQPAISGSAEGWSGYVVYLQQARPLGGPAWAAITVSAAGRVRTWFWSGGGWY